MYRRRLVVAATLTALCMFLLPPLALASVELVSFTAEATSDSILIAWETATERDVIGFKVYRSTVESPGDWGAGIHEAAAQGSIQGGYSYEYEDRDSVEQGIRYYYLLREITTSGNLVDLGTASAGIGLPADTPTATPTLTRTATATSRVTTLPTATPVRPTATRRFTDAPPTAAPGTPLPRVGTAAVAVRTPTRAPLPGARVATPTGPAPRVTIPVAAVPTVKPVIVADTLLSPLRPTPTAILVAIGKGTAVETPTPLPTEDATPAIFSSQPEDSGSPTPQGAEQVAGAGARPTTLALVIGGSAIGLAGFAAAVLLFLRSRRS